MRLVRSFKFTIRYIYDVHSLCNLTFGDYVDRIYSIELEIKDITYTGLLHILIYTYNLTLTMRAG